MSKTIHRRNSVQPQKEALAEAIRVARARKRMSQKEVADSAGVSIVRVSQMENASADPRFSTVARIAQALDLEISVGPEKLAS